MDIYEIINHRQSDRQYDPERPVEPEKIRRILEAARIAPSACNAQPWHFIVVDEPELRNQVADAVASRILGMNHFTKQAPCRGGATQFHIGHRRAHQGQTISAARHRYRCRTHHPRRHCRRIGQLHTRLVRRESRA